uniref:Surfactant protein C n=1 Tax=Anas platyrhynchos platyrhynchos TaxID=8840 RepID=A0A493T957_ANAPP
SPRLPCVPQQLKSLLMVVVAVVFLVVLVGAFLLLGLHLTETHAETVRKEGGRTHCAQRGASRGVPPLHARGWADGGAACTQLLVSYRSWLHRVCFITRVDEDNLPGLDAVTEVFQAPAVSPQGEGKAGAEPLADRSILGTTANVLCSSVPIYWT